MNTNTRRWVKLDGTRNCRDLGGIPVAKGITKFGVLYRSDALNLLSEADQQRLQALNLAAIIDFRAAFETLRKGPLLDKRLTIMDNKTSRAGDGKAKLFSVKSASNVAVSSGRASSGSGVVPVHK